MRTEEILATIDHALDDWAVSGDAMRWTPEPATPRLTIAEPRQEGRATLHFGGPVRFWFGPPGTLPCLPVLEHDHDHEWVDTTVLEENERVEICAAGGCTATRTAPL